MHARPLPVLLFALGLALGPPGTAAPEPVNLSTAKDAVRAYVASGAYDRAVAEVAAAAQDWIVRRARVAPRPGEPARLAVVFDLDDTLLRNLPTLLAHDFAYDPPAWSKWVQAGDAPAMAPVREVYRTACRLGLAVVFLTARRESERAATQRNLRAIGCDRYEELICEPDDSPLESGPFKLGERRRLRRAGYVIIANLGDQPSDFLGGEAERDFKLPNPFYLTP